MRIRPIFPEQIGGIPDDWKRYLKAVHDDLYPQLQGFTPTIPGLSNGVVSAQLMRMGRFWNINITVTPSSGSSTTSGAYADLPFSAFSNSSFVVNVDASTTLSAYILKNTSRLYLPDWTSNSRVIVSGTVGE